MASYYLAQRPSNLFSHKTIKNGNNTVLRLPQKGEGLGKLLRTFFKWILPAGKSLISAGKSAFKTVADSNLAKSTAESLKKEAATAGINLAQSALRGDNLKESLSKQSKIAAENVGQSISKSLEQYRPPSDIKKEKKKKRSSKTDPLREKRMKFGNDNLT